MKSPHEEALNAFLNNAGQEEIEQNIAEKKNGF
jgi:hypothetical protein